MYSHLFLQVVTGSLGTSTNLERWTDIPSYPPHMQPNFDSGRMREAVKDSTSEELKFQGSHFSHFQKQITSFDLLPQQEARKFGRCLTFKQNKQNQILESRKPNRRRQERGGSVECSEQIKLRLSSHEGLFSTGKTMKRNVNPSINPAFTESTMCWALEGIQ